MGCSPPERWAEPGPFLFPTCQGVRIVQTPFNDWMDRGDTWDYPPPKRSNAFFCRFAPKFGPALCAEPKNRSFWPCHCFASHLPLLFDWRGVRTTSHPPLHRTLNSSCIHLEIPQSEGEGFVSVEGGLISGQGKRWKRWRYCWTRSQSFSAEAWMH